MGGNRSSDVVYLESQIGEKVDSLEHVRRKVQSQNSNRWTLTLVKGEKT